MTPNDPAARANKATAAPEVEFPAPTAYGAGGHNAVVATPPTALDRELGALIAGHRNGVDAAEHRAGLAFESATRRRVVVSGMGVISPLGHNVSDTWAGLVAGKSAIGPITLCDASAYPT